MKRTLAFLGLAIAGLPLWAAETQSEASAPKPVEAAAATPTPVAAGYDPLKVTTPEEKIVSILLEVKDEARARTLPLRVYLPESREPAPVILFSHGLGGSRDNNPYLGNHWAGRGYVVVFIQHPGSDEAVWKGVGVGERAVALKAAASVENYLQRAKDVPVVIDALAKWNASQEEGAPLSHRLDLARLGMSGHSFGAQTTQAVSGQKLLRGRVSFTEPRIRAAVMMSPAPPSTGEPAEAFAEVKIPWLLLTGTDDQSPIGGTTAADRLKVFPALQQAPAWQVVLAGAQHMAFGQRDLAGRAPAEPRYHRAVLALTTAFWDAELKGDSAARRWLTGEGARSVLQPADQWEMNGKAKAEGEAKAREEAPKP